MIWWLLEAAWAATGCSLADPDADIQRFFPSAAAYTVNYVSFAVQAPDAHAELGRRLGGLDPLYETDDVPYTLYTVRGEAGLLGYVWGTNQRGRYANLQVIAVTDAELELQQVYLQKIRSPEWELLSSEAFLEQLGSCWQGRDCAVADPTDGRDVEDYEALVRALDKLWSLGELLLHPGEPPPWEGAAVAEWIANLRLEALVREVMDTPSYVPVTAAYLAETAPVAVVQLEGRVRVLPLEVLQRHPVVVDGLEVVTWSSTTGSVAAFRGPPMVPTQDVLFDARVVRDAESGTVWSPELAAGLYGTRAGDPLERLGVGVTSWSEARSRWPVAEVLVGPAETVELDLDDAVVALPGQGAWLWRELPDELVAGGTRIVKNPAGALAWSGDELVPLLVLPETSWRALFPGEPLGTR